LQHFRQQLSALARHPYCAFNIVDAHERRGEIAMKIHHVLVEIVILGSIAACVLALVIATLGTAAGAVGAVRPSQAIQIFSHNIADRRTS